MDQSVNPARASQQGSKLKIGEIILKTSRMEETKAWYRTVLGSGPFFERMPGPDGNNVEVTTQNYPSLAAMVDFMSTDVLKNNPSSAEIEPRDFVSQFRAGTSAEELVRLPA